jgi:hypothetical protein
MFFCEEESPPAAGMLSSFTACRISSSISVVICTSATLFPLEIDFSILVTYDREQQSALRTKITYFFIVIREAAKYYTVSNDGWKWKYPALQEHIIPVRDSFELCVPVGMGMAILSDGSKTKIHLWRSYHYRCKSLTSHRDCCQLPCAPNKLQLISPLA